MVFVEHLRDLHAQLGATPRESAAWLGTDPLELANFLGGERLPSLEVLKRLHQLFATQTGISPTHEYFMRSRELLYAAARSKGRLNAREYELASAAERVEQQEGELSESLVKLTEELALEREREQWAQEEIERLYSDPAREDAGDAAWQWSAQRDRASERVAVLDGQLRENQAILRLVRGDRERLEQARAETAREMSALGLQPGGQPGAEVAARPAQVGSVFVDLTRRTLRLIQRQLMLLSDLEREEGDPDRLSGLFRLDHLSTRMRRTGETLLALADQEPGRRWRRPAPLVDVLRAAASEVEQYERVELSGVPEVEIAGPAVNDLVHLLAELVENATSFSGPRTSVYATGHLLPDGRIVVRIDDSGIGMSPEDCAVHNERLADPPPVDGRISGGIGMLIAGRLAKRQGVRVQLRPSETTGTTALVMLPATVVEPSAQHGGQPG
ncbi:ATP-binding protein [Wenjunlia tyrosinilytica]